MSIQTAYAILAGVTPEGDTPGDTAADMCRAATDSVVTLTETIGTTAAICCAVALIVLLLKNK